LEPDWAEATTWPWFYKCQPPSSNTKTLHDLLGTSCKSVAATMSFKQCGQMACVLRFAKMSGRKGRKTKPLDEGIIRMKRLV